MKQITYNAQLWIDLSKELQDKEVQSFSLGYDGKLYVLTTYSKDNVQYRTANGLYPRLHTDNPHDFVVYVATYSNIEMYVIPQQTWNYWFIQPLLNDELLLVCGRSKQSYKAKQEENASVFSLDGQYLRSFTIGDGIADMQTTSIGEIWTSYFDEGVSWSDTSTGLLRWDAIGTPLYNYTPIEELGDIFDCYAMNVDSDDVAWFHYYHQFPIVKIKDNMIVDYWLTPTSSHHHLCVWNNHVLLNGGMRDKSYQLWELKSNHGVKYVNTYEILPIGYKATRGSSVVIFNNNKFYRFGISELFWSIH